MSITKRVWMIVVCACIMGGIIYMVFPFTSPMLMTGAISLSRPESAIRRDILRITPIGTSMEDVLKVIEDRGWKLRYTSRTSGYFITHRNGRTRVNDGASLSQIESGRYVEIGTKSIRIDLGEFRAIFDIGVDVYFAFDNEWKLIDVAIRREMDVI